MLTPPSTFSPSIATAFFDDDERHAQLMLSADAMPKAALLRQQQAANAAAGSMRDLEKIRDDDSGEDDFTEDVEEDVVSASRWRHIVYSCV